MKWLSGSVYVTTFLQFVYLWLLNSGDKHLSAANQNLLAGSRKGKDACSLSDGFNLLRLDMEQLMGETRLDMGQLMGETS